jgi:hypothetical protein
MRVRLFIGALLMLLIPQGARAEDCTKLPNQVEQIACLQHTIEGLQRQVAAIQQRQRESMADRNSIEALVDAKLKRAFEPRLHQD